MTPSEYQNSLERYYYLMEIKATRQLTDNEEIEFNNLYLKILDYED